VTKKEDDIKFYENQKGPKTAMMIGEDKQFVGQKKIKSDCTCSSLIKCKSR